MRTVSLHRLAVPLQSLLVAAALLAPVVGAGQETVYAGYAWEDLGNDVFLHRRSDPLAGPVDGNSTIVVGERGIVVIDTHINPAAARAVIEKIRSFWDQPVTHVVNTHWHDDHTNGNASFREAWPDVKIVASTATVEALRREWAPMEEQRRVGYAQVDLAELRARADALADEEPATATGYRVFADYVEALRPELETLTLAYPETLIDEALVIDLGDRNVQLQPVGSGNTRGDVIAWLPEDRLLITGDIVVSPVPFAFDSPMIEWIDTLERLETYDAETIVPGHGPALRDNRQLEALGALLSFTVDSVRDAKARGVALQDIGAEIDFSDFEQRFAGRDTLHRWAWQSYYVAPGIRSAWTSLGYPEPKAAQ